MKWELPIVFPLYLRRRITMIAQTPSTPSTAGVYDDGLALVNADDVVFQDFTDDVDFSNSPSQWCMDAQRSLQTLQSVLTDADGDDPSFHMERIHPLSLHEEVEREIQRIIHGKSIKPRTIDDIETDVRESSTQSDYLLKSTELASYYADSKFDKFFRNLKLQLSHLNAAPPVVEKSDNLVGCVTFQFYKTSNKREIKLVEIDAPLSYSLLDLFTYVCAQLPNDYMFDGPVYAGSGLIVIGHNMYVTGDEDYSVPISNWLGPNVPYTVTQMSECVIGEMSNLTCLCCNTESGFLIFNGDEQLRFFVSNIKLSSSITDYPVLKFKRKVARITRCVLCKTTAADLVILNDQMLPYNPSYCCTRCYRRYRANREGKFIPPPSDVIVSVYRQI